MHWFRVRVPEGDVRVLGLGWILLCGGVEV